jgi:hypothetical protein
LAAYFVDRLPVDILHSEKRLLVVEMPRVQEPGNVGMNEFRQDLPLLAETARAAGRARRAAEA